MGNETVHPCPLFEGSEKRIVVEFSLGAATPFNGLRAISRAQLDALMQQVCSPAKLQHFACTLAPAYKRTEAGPQGRAERLAFGWVGLPFCNQIDMWVHNGKP